MFKYKTGIEDLNKNCYSLVWGILSDLVMIMIMITMTMYLTCCEMEVKCVSLSIMQIFFPPRFPD